VQVHSEFRKILEPICVTPLQAGVLLFLSRHADANLTDTAIALGVKPPTLSTVVTDLMRKRWITKSRSVADTRAVCLSLRRRGEALARRIEGQVRQVSTQVEYKIVAKEK
jgi:DNA-binding MarR family transcriptional regulator